MKKIVTIISLACITVYAPSCNNTPAANKETNSYQSATDTELAEYISKIKAVDNHAHPNTIDPNDKGSDALPLDGLGAINLPARLRPESPDWLLSLKALYGFDDTVLNENSMKDLLATEDSVMKEKGEKFPDWVL